MQRRTVVWLALAAGGAWQPVGQTPLHADSPDYAGSDPVEPAVPSMLGWKTLSGRIAANPNRIIAATYARGVWAHTLK
jgi:hypothetical protein